VHPMTNKRMQKKTGPMIHPLERPSRRRSCSVRRVLTPTLAAVFIGFPHPVHAEHGEHLPAGPDPNAKPPSEERLFEQYRTALRKINEPHAILFRIGRRHVALLPERRLLVVTSEYSRRRGYLGVSVLALVLDHRHRLRRVVFVDSPDTPTYVKIVRIRMKRLLGQRLREQHRPVLAITGATSTADAVSNTVNDTLDQLAALLKDARITENGIQVNGRPLPPLRTLSAD